MRGNSPYTQQSLFAPTRGLEKGGVIPSVHISFDALFYYQATMIFFSHSISRTFPSSFPSSSYHSVFCSFLLLCYIFLCKQSHDALCGWEKLPQHSPRSHLLFSVKILLRRPKCLNKSWQRVDWQAALLFTFSPQPCVLSLPWKLFGASWPFCSGSVSQAAGRIGYADWYSCVLWTKC